MADADKCHLLIPYKEALSGVTVDGEGKVSSESLRRAAGQNFENYKAIENRINDPGCGGCNGEAEAFDFSAWTVASGGALNALILQAPNIGLLWNTEGLTTLPTLPAGLWQMNVSVTVGTVSLWAPTAGQVTVRVSNPASYNANYGVAYLDSHNGDVFSFSTVIATSFPWIPTLQATNTTTVSVGINGEVTIAQLCTPPPIIEAP